MVSTNKTPVIKIVIPERIARLCRPEKRQSQNAVCTKIIIIQRILMHPG